jgi:phage-related protein
MSNNIEEMRQSMAQAGVYSKADIDKICELEKQYREECKEIAEQCEAEGYPANGSNVGTDISRVLYFFYYQGRIILTHGFVKKAQKTPPSEIEKTKKYRKDFIERNGE